MIAFSPKIFDNAFFPQNEMQTTTREMLYPNPTVSPHIVRNYDFLVNITSIIIRGDFKYYFADFVRITEGGVP